MLTNYDAKAVAEVMGIAFLRSSKVGPLPPATSSTTAKGVTRSPTSVFGGNFVICVDDALVLVVEAKTNNTFAQFNH